MSLDSRLKDITVKFYDTHDNTWASIDEFIAQIKKLFTDEGYVQSNTIPEGTLKVGDHIAIGKNLMTGQEWFNRFEKELYTEEATSLKRNILMDMIGVLLEAPTESSVELWKLHIDAALDQLDQAVNEAAAKKAAGLE